MFEGIEYFEDTVLRDAVTRYSASGLFLHILSILEFGFEKVFLFVYFRPFNHSFFYSIRSNGSIAATKSLFEKSITQV